MKVKCPKCGHEFEVETTKIVPVLRVSTLKIKPDMSGSSLVYGGLGIEKDEEERYECSK